MPRISRVGVDIKHARLFHHKGRNRLTVASQRKKTARPPKGLAGSDEAILYSGNILYDPGFELFVGNAVGSYLKKPWIADTGSTTFTLPRFDITRPLGQRWHNGDSVTYDDVAQWAQYTEPYEQFDDNREASHWQVIRREAPPTGQDLDFTTIRGPKLGKWLARWYDWQSSGDYAFGNSVPGGLVIQGPGMPAGYSGRTEPGALIGWGFWIWKNGAGLGDEIVDLCLTFYNQSGFPVRTVTTANNITETKTEISLSSNSPPGSYFMRACCTFRGVGTRDLMVNVDTGILSVE